MEYSSNGPHLIIAHGPHLGISASHRPPASSPPLRIGLATRTSHRLRSLVHLLKHPYLPRRRAAGDGSHPAPQHKQQPKVQRRQRTIVHCTEAADAQVATSCQQNQSRPLPPPTWIYLLRVASHHVLGNLYVFVGTRIQWL